MRNKLNTIFDGKISEVKWLTEREIEFKISGYIELLVIFKTIDNGLSR